MGMLVYKIFCKGNLFGNAHAIAKFALGILHSASGLLLRSVCTYIQRYSTYIYKIDRYIHRSIAGSSPQIHSTAAPGLHGCQRMQRVFAPSCYASLPEKLADGISLHPVSSAACMKPFHVSPRKDSKQDHMLLRAGCCNKHLQLSHGRTHLHQPCACIITSGHTATFLHTPDWKFYLPRLSPPCGVNG